MVPINVPLVPREVMKWVMRPPDDNVAGDAYQLNVQAFVTKLAELAADKHRKMTHRRGGITEGDALQLAVAEFRRA